MPPGYSSFENQSPSRALARASLKRGRNELAESILTQALVIDPSNPEIHFLQGLALRESGRLAPAMQKFSKAVELRPDYAEAHYNLGVFYELNRKDLPKALAQYHRYLKLGGRDDRVERIVGAGGR